jgi:hypothetical protein
MGVRAERGELKFYKYEAFQLVLLVLPLSLLVLT